MACGRPGKRLQQSVWVVLAKYNLALATLFGVLALVSRTALRNQALVVENGVLAVLFGAVETYAWLSA